MRRRGCVKALASALAVVHGRATLAQGGETVLVAAAASVQRAMEEIAQAWTRASGQRVSLIYGASGNFARQIPQGLPVELFLSADEDFALQLAAAGLTRGKGVVYANGRLALVVAPGGSIQLDPQLQGLRAAWPTVRKFAIANPALAPYGKAAREVLQAVGLWESAQARLVMGENIGQATQFVATGAAEAGISALSLLVATPGASVRHVALPDSLHAPLRQRMVLLKRARPAAVAFYDYLQSPPAQAVLQRHGFATAER